VKTLYDKVSNVCLTPVNGDGFDFGEVCVNAATGESYDTLDAALAAAGPHETVRITDEPMEAIVVTAKSGVSIENPYPSKITVKAPAAWFDVQQSGMAYTIALNAQAAPTVSSDPEYPGVEVVDGQLTIRLSNVKDGLYYTLLTAPSPATPTADWTRLGDYSSEAVFTVDLIGPNGYYRPVVKDVP